MFLFFCLLLMLVCKRYGIAAAAARVCIALAWQHACAVLAFVEAAERHARSAACRVGCAGAPPWMAWRGGLPVCLDGGV